MKNKLDEVDYGILSLLSEDAQMAYTEVAKKIGVSAGTIHMRIKKLRDLNIVKGTTLLIDYGEMGWKLTVYVGIYLKESRDYKKVIEKLRVIPEVVHIHHVTGKYAIFIKVHARDTRHYRDVYQDHIVVIDGIEATEAFISMDEDLNRHIIFGT